MNGLYRKLRVFIESFVFMIMFFFVFLFFNFSVANAKEEMHVPIYIIQEDNSKEIFVDISKYENYQIEKFIMRDVNLKNEIKLSHVDDRFIINQDLVNNGEYELELVLFDRKNRDKRHVNFKFNYVENKFHVKKTQINSYNAIVNYDGKNLIFIKSIDVVAQDSFDKVDFRFSKNAQELENYKNKVELNNIKLKPGTTYNFFCTIELNSGIKIVSKQKIKTKNFQITELESKMVDSKKIKVDWKVSDKDIQFGDTDSIEVYVKLPKEYNYSQIPNLVVKDFNENSLVVEAKEISSEYEIMLVYNISGKKFRKQITQNNDYYKVNSEVSIANSRILKLKMDFDKKYKFQNGEILNLYLVDENDENKILSEKISDMKFDPSFKFEFNELKLGKDYKLIYEIVCENGVSLKIKEDSISVPTFEIKNLNVFSFKDRHGNEKINLKWELSDNKFKFLHGDSLAVYIDNFGFYDSKIEPFYYNDKDLNNLSSITLDSNGIFNGDYKVRLLYTICGKTYSKVKDIKIDFPNNDITLFYDMGEDKNSQKNSRVKVIQKDDLIMFTNLEQGSVSQQQEQNAEQQNTQQETKPELPKEYDKIIENQKDFKVKVIPTKVTSTGIDFQLFNKGGFKFEDKDSINVKYREKLDNNKNEWIVVRKYIHSSGGEKVKSSLRNENSEPPKPQQPQHPQSQIVQQDIPQPPQQSETTPPVQEQQQIEQEVDLNGSDIPIVSVTGLLPNKEYEFDFEFEVKDSVLIGTTLPIPLPNQENLPAEEDNSESPELQGQDSGNGGLVPGVGDGVAGVPGTGGVPGVGTPAAFRTLKEQENKEENVNPQTIKLNIPTKNFEITDFKVDTVRTNSAVFSWKLNTENNTFGEKDKLEIFIKRKVVGGYPVGAAFSKTGSEINSILTGEVIVTHMKMEYDAKIVYTIGNHKYEKTVGFTTKSGTASCSIKSVNEYSAQLDVVYPEDYKFLDNDCMEIYIKGEDDKDFGFPYMTIFNFDESQKIEDVTTFYLSYLKPKMSYDVLIKFVNKANDIPNCTTKFLTSAVNLGNCRIENFNVDKVKIKTDFMNDPDVLNYINLILDIFYKEPTEKNYRQGSLEFVKNDGVLDVDCKLPNPFSDCDLLISFNPHSQFSETLFIEFELQYRTIKPDVLIYDGEENGENKKVFDLNWSYPDGVMLNPGDKLEIYLKEIIDDGNKSNTSVTKIEDKNGSGGVIIGGATGAIDSSYQKIHTIESGVETMNTFNLDYFLTAGKKYEVIIQPISKIYKCGPGKVKFFAEPPDEKEKIEEEVSEEIFETPVTVEEFKGSGDNLKFPLPDLGSVKVDDTMEIVSGIEGVSVSLNEDNEIDIKGLVPGKVYEKIEIKVVVEAGKEISFNIENIKLEPEEEVQGFLFSVYKKSFLRDPDESGYHYWIGRLKEKTITSRDFLINLLFAEKEFSEMQYSTNELISVLYSIIVNRDPDEEGLNFWINFYNNDALKNSDGDVFLAKKITVDRMINEKEFEKLMTSMGIAY